MAAISSSRLAMGSRSTSRLSTGLRQLENSSNSTTTQAMSEPTSNKAKLICGCPSMARPRYTRCSNAPTMVPVRTCERLAGAWPLKVCHWRYAATDKNRRRELLLLIRTCPISCQERQFRTRRALVKVRVWGRGGGGVYCALNFYGFESSAMFESLTDRLGSALKSITGQAKLTEDNIKATVREVRMALLEADVALPVVKAFTEQVKERAIGAEVVKSLNPGQVFLKIVHEELMQDMGEAYEKLNLSTPPPAIVLMAGLQGAGKATTVGKLARFLIDLEKKKVMVVSADVYRPAAIKQLETLANDVGALFHPSSADQKPVDIAKAAIDAAKRAAADVLLVDTAGRLAVDEEMMAEIKQLHAAINPIETLFVVDAMTGQDAANT